MQPHDPPEERTVSTHAVELVVAAILMLIAMVVMADSWRLGASWSDSGPEAGYFPFYVGLVLLLASTGIFVSELFKRSNGVANFVGRTSFGHVMQVFLPTIVYVIAIRYLGIYVASTLYLALFMRFIGGYSLLKALPLGVAISAILFWLFEVAFLIPLPKGPLEAALGY